MRKYRARTSVFFIQTPLNFDIDSKEQHKLIWRRRRRNYVVYKEMHSTSIKSKHRILICPFYIQIMGLHFKSFDVGKSPFCGKVYLWKLFTVGWNWQKSCLFDTYSHVSLIFRFWLSVPFDYTIYMLVDHGHGSMMRKGRWKSSS